MYQLKSTSPEQLNSLAICHMASFPDSFGTKLGFKYTKKSLEWFLAGDNRFLFHIVNEDKVIGYCGGFQSTGLGDGSTSGMMQYAMNQAAIGMLKKPWLFFNKDVVKFYPLIIKNIFKKIIEKKRKAIAANKIGNKTNVVGLVVIGVHPAERGKGYFELLMEHFEEICKQRNVSKMILSVKASNTRAIGAYERTGWLTGMQTSKAIEMYKMIDA
jgi:GNAT superfamily N-acetyltransferase